MKKKRVPKGTSDYQSSWIVESEDESDEDSGEEDIDIDDEDHANLMQSEEESESVSCAPSKSSSGKSSTLIMFICVKFEIKGRASVYLTCHSCFGRCTATCAL